jgi:carboxylesterase type B
MQKVGASPVRQEAPSDSKLKMDPRQVWWRRMHQKERSYEIQVKGWKRAPQTMEIPFMMYSYNRVRQYVGPVPEPDQMGRQFSDAWAAFARTGKPDAKSIPHWPAYDPTTRSTMIFNVKSQVVNDPNQEVRKVLQST